MAVGQFVWGAVQPIAGAVAAFCNLPIREPEIEGYAVPAYLMGFRLAQESSSPSARNHIWSERANGNVAQVQPSGGIDVTIGGSPRNRRHQGVIIGIRKKKIATALIAPEIGRLKKIARDP